MELSARRGTPPGETVPPEYDMGPLLRQYFDAIFLLNIHGIIHKDRAENYFSECIRWFLFQSLLYLEPENLIKAYLAAISTCDEMAQSVVYDKNAYELYKGQASEHRNELVRLNVTSAHCQLAETGIGGHGTTQKNVLCIRNLRIVMSKNCNKSHEGIEKEATEMTSLNSDQPIYEPHPSDCRATRELEFLAPIALNILNATIIFIITAKAVSAKHAFSKKCCAWSIHRGNIS